MYSEYQAQYVALREKKREKNYLVFGIEHSEPYSCTCIPKKHTSVPSISSKANIAFALYGNESGKSVWSGNLIK